MDPMKFHLITMPPPTYQELIHNKQKFIGEIHITTVFFQYAQPYAEASRDCELIIIQLIFLI